MSKSPTPQDKFKKFPQQLFILLSCVVVLSFSAYGATYYVSNSGNDSNDGLSPEQAWATTAKVNNTDFLAGDNILFDCNSTWRLPKDGWLELQFGNSSANITYSSYGNCNGRKPLLMGSNLSNSISDWIDLGGNKWNYVPKTLLVSNLVFPDQTIGVMNFSLSAIDGQGDFFCNRTTFNLSMYSVGNPVTVYGSIEIVYANNIINAPNGFGQRNVKVERLELKYGGSHGINIVDGSYIYLINNTISYMGGKNTGTTVRQGNGIELYRGVTDSYIGYNNVSNVYDALYTIQASSGGGAFTSGNNTFEYNIGSNGEYGFEFFQEHATSSNRGLTINQNTFVDLGNTIFNGQRIDTIHGRCFRVGASYNVSRINFTNNICYGAEQYVYASFSSPYNNWVGDSNLTINNNLLWRNFSSGLTSNFALFTPLSQTYATLSEWQANTTKDSNSVFALPLLISGTNQPAYNSPACTMSSTGSYVGAVGCQTLSNQCIVGQTESCFIYTSNGNISLNFTGYKNFTQTVNTVTLLSTSTNYSAYWTHNSTVAFNNLKNATLTTPTNGNLEVKISSASGGCDYIGIPNFKLYANTVVCNATYSWLNYSVNRPNMYFKTGSLPLTNLSLFNLTDQGYPFVDIFYSNQTTRVASDVNEWNRTIAAGNRTFIFNYLTATEPRYKDVAIGISGLSSIGLSSNAAEFNCTGAGTITLSGLNSIIDESGFYSVYHNGIFVEETFTDTYTTDGSCSSWQFISSESIQEAQNTVNSTTESLVKLMKIFGLIASLLVVIFGVYALYNGTMDEQQFMQLVFIVLVTAIAFVIMLAVLEFV